MTTRPSTATGCRAGRRTLAQTSPDPGAEPGNFDELPAEYPLNDRQAVRPLPNGGLGVYARCTNLMGGGRWAGGATLGPSPRTRFVRPSLAKPWPRVDDPGAGQKFALAVVSDPGAGRKSAFAVVDDPGRGRKLALARVGDPGGGRKSALARVGDPGGGRKLALARVGDPDGGRKLALARVYDRAPR